MKKLNKTPNVPQNEKLNFETGEMEQIPLGQLNEVIVTEEIRPNGTVRRRTDYKNCPTLAEQHTAHLTNLNYLIEKYQPDELAAYLAARDQYRQEIMGHDFASEPSLQDAKNHVYYSKQAYAELPEKVRNQFRSHLDFIKYADNPRNAQLLVDNGIVTSEQLQNILISDQPLVMTAKIHPPGETPKTDNQQSDTKS